MKTLLETLLKTGPATVSELCNQAKLDWEYVLYTLESMPEVCATGDYRNDERVWCWRQS